MRLLFLTLSNKNSHPLSKYVDLNRTFDWSFVEDGLKDSCEIIHVYDYYGSFVDNGPFSMEENILRLVKTHKIQLIIVLSIFYEIAPSFLEKLRQLGCRSLMMFFDDSIRFEELNRFYLNSFDYYLTHESRESKSLYKPHGIVPDFFPLYPSHTFYEKVIHNLDNPKLMAFANKVSFVGANIADRDFYVNYLKANDVEIAVYGSGWPAGLLSTEEMLAAFNRSKISLNFIRTIDGTGRQQLKARVFEIIMAGGFVLSEHCDELSDYFNIGREIETFETADELLNKIRYFLENEEAREDMALRAKAKAIRNYTFEASWKQYLTKIKEGNLRSSYPNPNYVVPVTAFKAFIEWNFMFVVGRFMVGEYKLAYQHYKYCKRELKFLSYGKPISLSFSCCAFRILLKRIANEIKNKFTRRKLVRFCFL